MSTQSPTPDAAQQQRLARARDALQGVQARWGVTREAQQAPAVLPLSEGVAEVMPAGLTRGHVVRVQGSTSLMLALAAEGSKEGSWAAVIGMPAVGAVAAARRGMDLSRLVLVPQPGAQAAAAAGACVDGMDLILLGANLALSDGDRRRLAARAKERGCVILTSGRWPGAQTDLHVERTRWSGLGAGGGRLRKSEMTVAVTGRRQSGVRRVRVVLDRDDAWVSSSASATVREGAA
ncbi:hypothetical protein [Demequina flava]|uniref:hypothetical protein n=1 Tax=Demequina flava TaxID=1095025 RepID=UPI00078492B2|nr:hypothetical protein [Demequina flava]